MRFLIRLLVNFLTVLAFAAIVRACISYIYGDVTETGIALFAFALVVTLVVTFVDGDDRETTN